jgi:hypothetical protein
VAPQEYGFTTFSPLIPNASRHPENTILQYLSASRLARRYRNFGFLSGACRLAVFENWNRWVITPINQKVGGSNPNRGAKFIRYESSPPSG